MSTKFRPGFFGKKREELVNQFNQKYGKGGWKVVHIVGEQEYGFLDSCKLFYEESYFQYLKDKKDIVDWICSFANVYDNSMTNVKSGTNYKIQETTANHIQDIVIRNVIARLDREFNRNSSDFLQIRGKRQGELLSPGKIPFYDPALIIQPSLRPGWAAENSVEDFWQSCKFVVVKEKQEVQA